MTGVQEYIGVDVGSVRTGLARGTNMARLAEPVRTVDTDIAVEAIAELAKELEAVGVVVGRPRSLAGKDTQQTDWVKNWVEGAKSQIKLPFYAQDEALTSVHAEPETLKSKATLGVDAHAAALILQDFLDTPETDRVRW